MTPNIGVTCNLEVVHYGGLWTEAAAMVPLTYVRAIARAGGRPLLLAPTPADRDAFELRLVRAAAERDLPCLGICRGMQVVNVAYGGLLAQHLPDRLEHDLHRAPDGGFADHQVEVEAESLAALAAGGTRVAVKSCHHQGVARVGTGLRVTARAAGDGTAEALEDAGRCFMLGVLWHPEEDEADRLIGAFVRECRR